MQEEQTDKQPIVSENKDSGLNRSGFVHTRGHDYNIFKYPASLSDARAHKVG